MTLPHERTRAVERTREFLRDLLDPKKTPKIPKAIREKAYRCLRHFPWDLDIDRAAKASPDVFGPTREKTSGELLEDGAMYLAKNLEESMFGNPDLPFEELDGEDFYDAPEPNEKLRKLMKGEEDK
jgi:hypothetical protein